MILIPQGPLYFVPFAALEDFDGKSLVERYTLSVVPSIEILQQLSSRNDLDLESTELDVLVVGNPTMPEVSFEAIGRNERLKALPGAEEEAKFVASMFGAEALIGDKARKDAVVTALERADLVHLATHGFLDDFTGDGVPGAIALAPQGLGKPNDGLLFASEILSMDLHADLVVLSACNTGKGNLSGDGVVGLSRAFISAGASSLLVSIWEVPDEATKQLMTAFYSRLKHGVRKGQALRQAMLEVKKTRPHPVNWAGFMLIGKP